MRDQIINQRKLHITVTHYENYHKHRLQSMNNITSVQGKLQQGISIPLYTEIIIVTQLQHERTTNYKLRISGSKKKL